jgi:GTPase
MPDIDRAILVGVFTGETSREYYDETVHELQELADTAGVEVVKVYVQSLPRPNTATYVGSGKIKEISDFALSHKTTTLIFNNNLSPSQSRNISDLTLCNVVDRTELIMDIFATHARTRQSRIQVELAQLEYSYTKLKRMWKHLSRIQGGIGFRGPGETQIETDRREIRKKVQLLKKKVSEIEKGSVTKRKKRKNITSISLVGYTNAGKSTLFNLLTNEKRYVKDQLFATLDALTRMIKMESEEDLVLTDTIGFIRNLPHRLVASFHSTLMEVIKAELLLHVVDISHLNLFEYINAVDKVLQELDTGAKNTLMVFNKCDKMSGPYYSFLKKKIVAEYPDAVFISALSGEGVEQLFNRIREFIRKYKNQLTLDIPCEMENLISFIQTVGEVTRIEEKKHDKIISITVKIPRFYISGIMKQIEDHNFLQYINK